MILEHRTIDLYGKMLFEKASIKAPFKKPTPMPNEACFLYILEGDYRAISETDQLRLQSNEAVLFKCGNYLSQMFSERSDGRYEAIAVHFYPEVLQKVYQHDLPTFLKQYNYSFHTNMVKVGASELVQKYIESLVFYFDHPNLVTEDILILKLKEIILLLLQTESSPRVVAILNHLFSERTYSFKEIVEAHICTDISLTDLAGLTNRSLSSFKREFKKLYAETPARYIMKKRVEIAARKLLVSDDSVSDIAYDCGFKDLSHFSKLFKATYGVAPSHYRSQALTSPNF